MPTTEEKQPTGAEDIHWNLTDLYQGLDDPQLEADMKANQEAAAAFAQKYRGRIASLDEDGLAQAMATFESIIIQLMKIEDFVSLTWTTDTQNPETGKWMARKNEHGVDIQQMLVFFAIEWAGAPQATADLADTPALARYRHYLNIKRLEKEFIRPEAEEKILSQMSLSGAQGWSRYFNELSSRWTYEVDGKELTLGEAISLLFQPDRQLRQRSTKAIAKVLSENSHATTYIFNMILLEKASTDSIRGYPTWISQRNLDNQISESSVEALVTAVTGRYDIVARYYRLLKQLLGYDELFSYDRYAPLAKTEVHIPWAEARDMTLEAFEAFDPRFRAIAQKFFDNNWIDAPPKKGKYTGAFCASLPVTSHAYVLLNYMGKMKDVMTLAHELGHGVHAELARQQSQVHTGYSRFHSLPLTTAETASTFGEMLLFDHLLQRQEDPAIRLAMRMERMQDTISTVFRQIGLNRFEERIHAARREQGELTTEQFSTYWMETQKAQFQDSVTLEDDYRLGWSYIPHFISTPGYVYAYAFGELLVWSLYALYQEKPDGFAGRFLDVLRAGTSDWPHNILTPMGVDLQDPDFWYQGLSYIDAFVASMEEDAAAVAG